MMRIFIIFILLLFNFCLNVYAFSEKKWSWSKTTYAPCENIGLTGSYRVNVEANIQENDDEHEIHSLSLWLYSASFQNGEVTQTAKLTVKRGEKDLQTVFLSRPSPNDDVVEQTPETNETKRLYLPKGTKLTIPSGARIFFVVTASVKTDQGSCFLGKSEKEINPDE